MHLFFVTRRMSFDPCRYSYLTEILLSLQLDGLLIGCRRYLLCGIRFNFFPLHDALDDRCFWVTESGRDL